MIKAMNSLSKKKEEKPAAPAGPTEEQKLLGEIRDLLKNKYEVDRTTQKVTSSFARHYLLRNKRLAFARQALTSFFIFPDLYSECVLIFSFNGFVHPTVIIGKELVGIFTTYLLTILGYHGITTL